MEYEVEKQPKPMCTTKPSLEPSPMILIISIEADLFTVSQIIELKNEWKCSDMIAKTLCASLGRLHEKQQRHSTHFQLVAVIECPADGEP